MNMVRALALVATMFGSVLGCRSMSGQELFEYYMNGEIGRPVSQSPIVSGREARPLGGNKIEYVVQDKRTGCVLVFLVDEKTGLIQSWHYKSDPSVCRLYTSAPW